MGRPPTEKPRKRQVGWRVTEDEHRVIMDLAARHGWTASDLIRALVLTVSTSARNPKSVLPMILLEDDEIEVLRTVMESASSGMGKVTAPP